MTAALDTYAELRLAEGKLLRWGERETKAAWTDSELLLQVVEERYVSSRAGAGTASELWQRFFDATTHGLPTREYMAARVLPRPRDILYLTNAAIDVAVRHRRVKVTESDVIEAEAQYSQFAFESLLVEGTGDLPAYQAYLDISATGLSAQQSLEV